METRRPRTARQSAQQAAKALVAGRTSTVGDLAARHAELQAALGRTEAARTRGAQLVQAAQQQAQQLLDIAEQHAETQRARLHDAHQAARDAGWTSADLTALGLTLPASKPTSRSTRPPRPTNSPAAEPSAGTTTPPPSPDLAAQLGLEDCSEAEPSRQAPADLGGTGVSADAAGRSTVST